MRVVGLYLCLLLVGCSENLCVNRVLSTVASPDGAKVATLFVRDCGATVAFAQVVVINQRGDVFGGDDPEKFVFTMSGDAKVDVNWESADRLLIQRPSRKEKIYKELAEWQGVGISYSSQ